MSDGLSPSQPSKPVRLERALGRWDLTAIGVNQTIGAGVFFVPALVAGHVGPWSPILFLAIGVSTLLVALCFAEVGSRFDGTGGPYLYTRAAFGRFFSFEIGWMQWFMRVTAQASVINGLVLALGFYWPNITGGAGRVAIITGVIVSLAAVNVRGVRQAAWVVDMLTIGKLIPLAIFILVGMFFVDVARVTPTEPITTSDALAGALLLIFIFGGFDVIPVPAGESRDPKRHVPFALVMTVVGITGINTLVAVVAVGTLPTLASSETPLADAALAFMGVSGALLVGIGSVISIAGNTANQILTGSRTLYALAENGDLPRVLGRVHRSYHTPANTIIFTAGVALVLALSGSFAALAAASALARLLIYVGVCASTLRLRRSTVHQKLHPAQYILPFGAVIPALAILSALLIVLGLTMQHIVTGLAALVAGAALFWWRVRVEGRGETEKPDAGA